MNKDAMQVMYELLSNKDIIWDIIAFYKYPLLRTYKLLEEMLHPCIH